MANQQIQLKNKNGNIYPNPYWPVGSIFLSWNNTNPSTYFGGTWERLQNAFLYATSGSSGSSGNGTGTATNNHTLTIDQIPAHSHSNRFRNAWEWSTDTHGPTDGFSASVYNWYGDTAKYNALHPTYDTGGGKGHSHKIPYVAVVVWRRTK